jgi:hypothetical protein
MKFLPKFRCCGTLPKDSEGVGVDGGELGHAGADRYEESTGAWSASEISEESRLFRTIGWVSAALGAVAVGVIVGRELRQRYKFNRRTPYDLYSHSGDELPDVDCGVGI